jgi:hypothetical protein
MGGNVASMGATRNASIILVRNFKVRDDLGDMSVDGMIKIVLKERW